MKKILNIAFLALMTLIVAACGKEAPFPGPDAETGQLSVKKMILQIDNQENVVRSSIDVSTFIVDICRDGAVIDTYVYSEMPEVVTLPVGAYTVKVRSGELQPVAWETAYFEGEQDFEVKSKEITEVETVVCHLANVRVSVIFDETLLPAISDDSKVTVVMGDGASIDFAKGETRSAYFAYVPGSNTMVATFRGNINGDHYEELKAYTDVAPGNHYKITYSFHGADIPGDEGAVTFSGLLIDASVEEENLTFNVDIDDPTLEDDLRPGEGSDTPPEPPVPGSGPEVKLPDGSKINLDGGVVDIVDGDNYSLEITSETGFTTFKVDIESPYLTDEFMQSIEFTTHLDLINPGEYAAKIQGFGLPCNVGGSKREVFDISGLVPLLAMADEPGQVHSFRLTVADASGTVTKVLKFRN